MRLCILLLVLFSAVPAEAGGLADRLRQFDATVIPRDSELGKQLPQMLGASLRARRDDANVIESKIWHLRIRDKTDWEAYRDVRLRRLEKALGEFPRGSGELKVRLLRTLAGPGYEIDNLVYESRPGFLVTANLYRPSRPPKSMPGILIIHSHHNPRTQGELQDMGMTWARSGCMVLVPDQIGHGERRNHPFTDKTSYPAEFKVGRQDYYGRYNASLQLYLIGDSLMGWMVWDMMRGVDLLLSKPGIDDRRIILLGAVAGGGDPAAVTAALDLRISAVAPFNFGGPQPETKYPLPDDAESWFNYAGGGSWESTRGLAFSARDGFLPWVIVGSVAPRGLIYSHEFAWDKERDPVWKRLQKIWGLYDARDRLGFAHGRGLLQGKAPEATHCNNIGPEHRKPMYPILQKWFDMPPPDREYQKRHPTEDLLCLKDGVKSLPLHRLAGQIGAERLAAGRRERAKLSPDKNRASIRNAWADILGGAGPHSWKQTERATEVSDVTCLRTVLTSDGDIAVPVTLLLPARTGKTRVPVVVAVAQAGKQAFFQHRAAGVAKLLEQGVAVCLPDVRGTGETKPAADGRGRTSTGTSLSATALLTGQPLLGGRLRDLRAVLAYLRERPEIDPQRIALWGDSFAPVNPPERNLQVPWDAPKLPDQSEPLGGLLALLGALYEDDVRAVYIRGGLVSYQSVLESPFLYLPHDAIVPGALKAGDLPDVARALGSRPLRLEHLVDGVNRRVSTEAMRDAYGASDAVLLHAQPSPADDVAAWLVSSLRKR